MAYLFMSVMEIALQSMKCTFSVIRSTDLYISNELIHAE